MAVDDSSLPDLAALPQHLQDELRRHEQRTIVALIKWRASRRAQSYDEALCGALCIRALAESHDYPGETEASRKARKNIRNFAEDLRQMIVDERNKARQKP
jgi:hypothetical protein